MRYASCRIYVFYCLSSSAHGLGGAGTCVKSQKESLSRNGKEISSRTPPGETEVDGALISICV